MRTFGADGQPSGNEKMKLPLANEIRARERRQWLRVSGALIAALQSGRQALPVDVSKAGEPTDSRWNDHRRRHARDDQHGRGAATFLCARESTLACLARVRHCGKFR